MPSTSPPDPALFTATLARLSLYALTIKLLTLIPAAAIAFFTAILARIDNSEGVGPSLHVFAASVIYQLVTALYHVSIATYFRSPASLHRSPLLTFAVPTLDALTAALIVLAGLRGLHSAQTSENSIFTLIYALIVGLFALSFCVAMSQLRTLDHLRRSLS